MEWNTLASKSNTKIALLLSTERIVQCQVIVENEPEWLKMEEKRKKRTQSRQVLSKVSQAVAQYKTQR